VKSIGLARFIGLAKLALASAAASLTLLGCGTSATPLYYTLDSTSASTGAPPADYGVMVGPVTVPASVDRPQFVVQVAPNRVEIDEFNRWAAPLPEGISRTITGDLAVLLDTPDVATAPFANFDPAYRVTINVQRFDSVPGRSVLIDAVWAVRVVASGATKSGRTLANEPVEGASYDAIAAAHSRALGRVSTDIAAAIRNADAAQ
jgi:uncharacterized lipoprotein YmbA